MNGAIQNKGVGMRKEILAKRNKIYKEINMLNKARAENDYNGINEKIDNLKKMYNYYNQLLKVIK